MEQRKMKMEYGNIAAAEIPLALLLEADPSEKRIRSYLPGAWCFAARAQGILVGVCVVRALSPGTAEIFNVAVRPDHQRRGIGSGLLRHGLTVEVAVDGIDALAQLEAKPFDLVLLDIMMPELDGYEVLKRMKASDNLRHIPVVMISALDELESVVRCIEAGAEDYLSKPFNPTLLRARIGACLEKKALRDQEQEYLATIETTQKRLKRELDDATTYVRSILPEPETKPYPIDWVYTPWCPHSRSR